MYNRNHCFRYTSRFHILLKYRFDINEKIVKDIYENLDTCHDIFTVLHEKFCFHRVADKDPSEEGKSKEKEDLYSDAVSKEVSSIRREYQI